MCDCESPTQGGTGIEDRGAFKTHTCMYVVTRITVGSPCRKVPEVKAQGITFKAANHH